MIILSFLLGTFIGSFLNVCVHRLPRNESVVQPPSRCYACGTRLTWYDNLPIIGWMLRQVSFWIVSKLPVGQVANLPASQIPHGAP